MSYLDTQLAEGMAQKLADAEALAKGYEKCMNQAQLDRQLWEDRAVALDAQLARMRSALSELLEAYLDGFHGPQHGGWETEPEVIAARDALRNGVATQSPL